MTIQKYILLYPIELNFIHFIPIEIIIQKNKISLKTITVNNEILYHEAFQKTYL
ncbi:unnamed protein product [Commensalibacter communis]|nr:unnamed protein product [Commensalibacter communis]CAI3940870.1 unnamed protein product [Commensalibacter communis]